MEPREELNFEKLYEKHYPGVLYRVKMKVPQDDAEDVTQDIFTALLLNMQMPDDVKSKYKGKSAFLTWFRRLEINKVADYYRNAFRYERRIERASGANPVPVHKGELQDRRQNHVLTNMMIYSVLDSLTPIYKEVLVLRFLKGLTFQNIADELGQTYEAVRSRYRRAMKRAREIMEGECV